MLEVKYFFKGYTFNFMIEALSTLNTKNVRCKCRGCTLLKRIHYLDTEDPEAACTFGPWFDNILHERGLFVLHTDLDAGGNGSYGLYNQGEKTEIPCLSNEDCHLVDSPMMGLEHLKFRWMQIYIGKRLWNVESIHNNQWIKQFERVFGECKKPLSSPPTPPASPKMAPQPPPPLPITTIINQGLELQELKKQLATQAAELQFCSFQ